MQSLARVSSLGTSYSAGTIAALVTSQSAYEDWRFELLDISGRFLKDITPYVDPSSPPQITHDSTQAVPRTIKLRVRADMPLDPDHHVIRARYLLRTADGGMVNWPVGTFPIHWPTRTVSPSRTWQVVDGSDVTGLLLDQFEQSYSVPAQTDYLTAVRGIVADLGSDWPLRLVMDNPSLFDPGLVAPAGLTWAAGKTRLSAINDVLQVINFVPLWADESGILRTTRIPDYDTLPASFLFDTTAGASIVTGDLTDTADPSQVINRVLVKVENPDPTLGPAFSIEYINDKPDSPVSTTRLRRTRTLEIADSRIPDSDTATRRGQVEAQAAAMGFSSTTVNTFAFPFGQNLDVYELRLSTLDEGPNVIDVMEQKWTVVCAPGALTQHTWARIVNA